MPQAAYYKGNEEIATGAGEKITPRANQVQVKIAYTGICGTDLHIFHGKMDQRVNIPQIMGHELSGTISEIGEGVEGFSIGQKVTVMPLDWCGDCPACKAGHTHICQNLKFMGIDTQGSFQEYWTVPARTIIPMPEEMNLKHGALIEPIAVACHDVRLGGVKAGDHVTVLGGGPIGALIGLVAKEKGAKVLISEINEFRIKILNDLGLEAVNPMEIDLEEKVIADTDGAGSDVVFEVTAHPSGADMATKLPRTRGRIVIVGIFSEPPKFNLFNFFWRELQLRGARVYEKEDFEEAVALAAQGKIPCDELITEVYPLDKLKDGFRLMETGGAVMKILVECSKQ